MRTLITPVGVGNKMEQFEVKNCGCNQDPCKTYGSEEEQKAQYEDLKETTMRKPSMKSLLTEWRKLVNEHVTDEEHEHPHGDENDEALNELDFSGPATQSDADVYGTPEQAEIEDALYECFCDWVVRSPNSSRQGGDLFSSFVDSVANKLGLADSESLKASLEDVMFR